MSTSASHPSSWSAYLDSIPEYASLSPSEWPLSLAQIRSTCVNGADISSPDAPDQLKKEFLEENSYKAIEGIWQAANYLAELFSTVLTKPGILPAISEYMAQSHTVANSTRAGPTVTAPRSGPDHSDLTR